MGQGLATLITGDPEEIIPVSKDDPILKKFILSKEDMTGWERVKFLFKPDDYGDFPPELIRCKDSVLMSLLVGILVGGVGRSKIEFQEHLRSNQHTVYESPLKGKKALSDRVVLGFGSGAFRFGWRLAAFTGIYMFTSTCVAAYRNKMGLVDPVCGGALAGFLYKFKEGPKPSMAGFAVGGLLGLTAGVFSIGITKLTGMDPEEATLYHYHAQKSRQEALRSAEEDIRVAKAEQEQFLISAKTNV